jgi:hypothetical protein
VTLPTRNTIILSSAYFGPVSYFTFILKSENILIEQYDHYSKQSYRNRCVIMGANEALNLVIPVKKPGGSKTLMKDILIDYDTNWQKLHYRSILSSYKSSPFFDYYFDDYITFFEKQEKFLLDLNLRTTDVILEQLTQDKNYLLTEKFEQANETILDLRDILHPKKSITDLEEFSIRQYTQVFSDKLGFLPNLSIIDLLFNTGPEAILYLK